MLILKHSIEIINNIDCSQDIVYDYLVYKTGSYYTKPTSILNENFLDKVIKKLNKKIGNPLIFISWKHVYMLDVLINDYELATTLGGLGGTNKIIRENEIFDFINNKNNFK